MHAVLKMASSSASISVNNDFDDIFITLNEDTWSEDTGFIKSVEDLEVLVSNFIQKSSLNACFFDIFIILILGINIIWFSVD